MSIPAADDYGFIAKRLAEIRTERERHTGVLNNPLPSVALDDGGDAHEPNLEVYVSF